jgi:hypothetical protein
MSILEKPDKEIVNYCMKLDIVSLKYFLDVCDSNKVIDLISPIYKRKSYGYLMSAIIEKMIENNGRVELFYTNIYTMVDPKVETTITIGFDEIEYDGENFEEILDIDYPRAFNIEIKAISEMLDEDEQIEAIEPQIPDCVEYKNSNVEDDILELVYSSKSKNNIVYLLEEVIEIYKYYGEDYHNFYKKMNSFKDGSIDENVEKLCMKF